jgi:hypothetical protein
MTLFSPFEQLEFFVPTPQRAFAEVVQTLLQDRFGLNVMQSCEIPDCLAARDPAGGLPECLSLYQPKYFLKDWHSVQRQQIRTAFQQAVTVRRNPPPHRWVLCVPATISPKDLYWFDRWRCVQPHAIEALEGNDLLRMLREPQGHRARQLLRGWGVTVPDSEGIGVHGRLRVSVAEPCSGLSHYLYVSLHHEGSDSVKGLRVELGHSPTHHVRLRQDEREWADEGGGNLNPRCLRAREPLLPQEDRPVAVIPIGMRTPLPVRLRLKLWSRSTGSVEQHLTLDRRALKSARQLDFLASPASKPELPQVWSIPAFAA